jgi:hypothetical protein
VTICHQTFWLAFIISQMRIGWLIFPGCQYEYWQPF